MGHYASMCSPQLKNNKKGNGSKGEGYATNASNMDTSLVIVHK
jgi:hypothetical protein